MSYKKGDQGDGANQHGKDGNYDGHNRTVDKEFRHGLLALSRGRNQGGVHYDAVSGLLNSLDDHPLARLEPFFNNPHGSSLLSNLYRPETDFVAVSHDGHLIHALELADRLLRHQHGAGPDVAHKTDTAKLPGTKYVVWIGKQARQPNRSRLNVNLAISSIEFALSRVGRSIGQDQFQIELLLRGRARRRCRVAPDESQVLLLA